MLELVWNWCLQIILSSDCSAENIDGLSTEGFFLPSERKGLLYNALDNEMSALARLAFYENLLIGQEISVRCPH